MICGVGFPSYRSGAVAGASVNVDPAWPAANGLDIKYVRKVVAAAAAGNMELRYTLAAPSPIQFLALALHNGVPGAAVDVQLLDASGNQVLAQTFTLPALPASPFLQTMPMYLAAPVVASQVHLTMRGNGALPWEIGAVEFSGWWDWSDEQMDRELGLQSTAFVLDQSNGVDHVMAQWSPRTLKGSRDYVAVAELDGLGIDFQQLGRSSPFVWCEDVSDPTLWARQCILAVNDTRPTIKATGPDFGTFSYELREHLA